MNGPFFTLLKIQLGGVGPFFLFNILKFAVAVGGNLAAIGHIYSPNHLLDYHKSKS